MTVPLIAMLVFAPAVVFAQDDQDYQVFKSESAESFTFPFSAANTQSDSPLTYSYEAPRGPSWIFTITNNLTYAPGEDAKVIVRLQEPAPSEKFIEVALYGGDSRKFWVAVNLPEAGYAQLYSQEVNGWSSDNPISLTHVSTSGLSVNDGRRIVVDRFDMDGFTVGSVSVYGRDDESTPVNTIGGNVSFDILFGSFQESPLYLVPALVTAGVGGTVIALLIVKKRKTSD